MEQVKRVYTFGNGQAEGDATISSVVKVPTLQK